VAESYDLSWQQFEQLEIVAKVMSGKRASQIIFIFCRTIIINLHNLNLLFNLSGCSFWFALGFEVENKFSEKIDSVASVVEGLCAYF
jgi:hypothetical protein